MSHKLLGTFLAAIIVAGGWILAVSIRPAPNPVATDTQTNQSLIVVTSSGGLCVTAGACDSTLTIDDDGTVINRFGAGGSRRTKLSSSELTRLRSLIASTDLASLKRSRSKLRCEIIADLPTETYTFTQDDGKKITLDPCQDDLDLSLPIFAAIRQATPASSMQPAS